MVLVQDFSLTFSSYDVYKHDSMLLYSVKDMILDYVCISVKNTWYMVSEHEIKCDQIFFQCMI